MIVPVWVYGLDGEPLDGVTPTVLLYTRRNSDGSISDLDSPTVSISADGKSTVTVPAEDAPEGSVVSGLLDMGATASNRYQTFHVRGTNAEHVVCFFIFSAATGAAASGLAAELDHYQRLNEGGSYDDLIGDAPEVVDHGNLLYSFEVDPEDWPNGSAIDYRVDCTTAALVRYLDGQLEHATASADDTAPVVSNVTPTAGTSLAVDTGIGFDVTDEGGNLARANVFAYYPALGVFEVVWFQEISGDWGSRAADFAPRYTGTRSEIANGFRFADVKRVGGWPAAPVIVAAPVDAAGNESE